MRALHTNKKTICLLISILLFTAFLLGVVIAFPFAQAEPSSSGTLYISADLTFNADTELGIPVKNTGDVLPDTLVYKGGAAYDFSFRLYEKTETGHWAESSEDGAKFDLLFDGQSTPPTAIGTYTAQVVANRWVVGYQYASKGESTSVISGVVIGEKTFSIVPETVSLVVPALDEKTSVVRTDDLRASDISSGLSVLVGSASLSAEEYEVSFETVSETPVAASDLLSAGAYRLKVVLHDQSHGLSAEHDAALSLTALSSDRTLSREFTVVDATNEFALSVTSVYEYDAASDAEVYLATSLGTASYTTSVLKVADPSAGMKVYNVFAATEGSASDRYKAFPAGNYLYRVTFTASYDPLGVKSGDVIDLPFTVHPVPYVVKYRKNSSVSDFVEYLVINTDASEAIALDPYFYDAESDAPISDRFRNNENKKYEVRYWKYVASSGTWNAESSPALPGRYKVEVLLKTGEMNKVVLSSYTIGAGSKLDEKEFQIIANESLTVSAANEGKSYYTGEGVPPTLDFKSGVENFDVTSLEGKYALSYESLVTTPKDVGEYCYIVTFTEDVEELDIHSGDTYRGTYSIVYETLGVTYADGEVSFTHNGAAFGELDALQKDVDYTLTYYLCTDEGVLLHKLTSAAEPTADGVYAVIVKFAASVNANAVCKVCNVKKDDVAIFRFEHRTETAGIRPFDASFEYDGGVKIPPISFKAKSGSDLALVEYVDYTVSYFKETLESNVYVYKPCGYPMLAGKYKRIVTFLKSDSARGMVRGTFKTQSFIITAQGISVVRTDAGGFVYDGEEKAVTVELRMTKTDKPFVGVIDTDYTVTYNATPVEVDSNPLTPDVIDAYTATVSIVKAGSYDLTGATILFNIEPLRLTAVFTTPTGADAMYSGANIAPTSLEYNVENGEKYRDKSYTAALLKSTSENKLDLSESELVYSPDAPKEPGWYDCTVTLGNKNVLFGYDDESNPIRTATCTYRITPCEVDVVFHFTGDSATPYYTGAPTGVTQVEFYAKNKAEPLSLWTLGTDYTISYYSCSYDGKQDHNYESDEPPVALGYYFARLTFKEGFAEDARYTIVNGYDADNAPLSNVKAGAYVDGRYRIIPQTELSASAEVLNEYVGNDVYKFVELSYVSNGYFKVDSLATKSISVSYNDGESVSAAPFEERDDGVKVLRSDPGEYTVTYTFKENTGYRITSAAGGVLTSANNIYISEGDTLSYTYVFVAQKEITIDWGFADEVYYDGTPKASSPLFETEQSAGVYAYVNLQERSHYLIYYYAVTQDGENKVYTKLTSAPTDPGDYVAEFVLQGDFPAYKYGDTVLRQENFTLKSAAGEAATAPAYPYTIKKAVLTLDGVSVANKYFDGTTKATLSGGIVLKETGKGKIVSEPVFTGELKGAFETKFPAEKVTFALDKTSEGFFALSVASAKYYDVLIPELSARIAPAIVTVTPTQTSSQYDFAKVSNYIHYEVSLADEALLVKLSLTKEELLTGELYRKSGISVGEYDIYTDRLGFATAVTLPAGYEGKALSDLFELVVVSKKYRILPRAVTLQIPSYEKAYGEADPEYNVSDLKIEKGSFLDGDELVILIERTKQGENVGTYRIENVSDIQVLNASGGNVTANYSVTILRGSLTIARKKIKIAPPSQTPTYLEGFDPYAVGVLDMDHDEKNVTKEYVTEPEGDRVAGKLSYKATDDPDVFMITIGTVRIVNKEGKDVSSNYDITFAEDRTYTISPQTIKVKIKSDATLEKYYGDPDPIIAFTIDDDEKANLGRLTLSASSSVGRVAGKDVGYYYLYTDNTAESFKVLDAGEDVSRYFTVEVTNFEYGTKTFEIKARPIIVLIEDATFENTGMDIHPVVRYLNEASGDRLSSTLLSELKVHYAAPSGFEYQKGENVVTPVVVGEVTEDPNFRITVRSGTITYVYLQDEVTATPLAEDDEMYQEHKYMLAGIMLYKPICFYKLSTGNGEQPSEAVEIVLPINSEFKGSGYVAVALYADGSPKAFALTQAGRTLVYSDENVYYVAIAEVQEWFYIILGVILVLAGVVVFLIVYFSIKLARKLQTPEKLAAKAAAKEAREAEKAKKKEEAKAKKLVSEPKKTEEPAPSDPNDPFSFVPVTASSEDIQPDTAEKEKASEDLDIPLYTDDLFADVQPDDLEEVSVTEEPVAPVKEAEPSPAPQTEAPQERVQQAAIFIPTAVEEEAPAEEEKVDKKALREQERAAQKEREREEKERKKREKEEEKERKQKEKESKKVKPEPKKPEPKKQAARPGMFVPSSFVPKGSAPAKKADDEFDIFPTAAPTSSDDLFSSEQISSDEIEISIPSSDSHGDDELVISRSSSFGEEEDEPKKDDEDLI